ncbi:MAG: polyprenyl synthetase family protein, partial [Thiohalobacterales bacterium]|nr:polyprenyl synthetase family protein [Thiohalobacterales bacterium]
MKTPDPPLAAFLADCQQRLDGTMEHWLPPASTHPVSLHSAMRYAVIGGGKRIRPTLVYASGRTVGAPAQELDGPAAAIELIHAYSLIHDDLPAMDDDDLRRGKPSCHRAFGEATAILAGDALQSLAFYLLAHDSTITRDAATRMRMIEMLSLAAGSRGMAGGQAIDLAATGRRRSGDAPFSIHIFHDAQAVPELKPKQAPPPDYYAERLQSLLDTVVSEYADLLPP